MSFDFDLIVIGSGPAGEKAAAKAAYFGKKVAVIERGPGVGGQCTKGGLPSKILRESALAYAGARHKLIEVFEPAPRQSMQMSSFLRAVDSVCDARDTRVRRNLDRHQVELLTGSATLIDAHRVRLSTPNDTRVLSAEIIVIATGSRPSRPAFIPFDDRTIFCSDTILTMKTLPRSMTVIGGGVIGSEYASIFATLGVSVHLIEERHTLIGFLDEEMAGHLCAQFSRRGVALHLGESVSRCELLKDGGAAVTTSKSAKIESEVVLFSGGRLANTEEIGLAEAGVKLGDKGRPVVDKFFRTSVSNIYAIGDLIGFPALASTSMEQGRVAVGHAFGLDDGRERTLATLPYGIYTIPSVSMFGKTEQALRADGKPYVVGHASYGEQDRGRLNGDVEGVLKLICDRDTRQILGIHILGDGAEELIHLGQACVQLGGTADYFLQAVFNFPTMSSLYKAAAYDVLTNLGKRQNSLR